VIVFAWLSGGSARLLETDGDRVSVLSSRAAPPGTPLEGELEGATYRIKVRSCRKSDADPSLPFQIEGRFQNLTREQRQRVLR